MTMFSVYCPKNLRLFDTSGFIWTDGLQVLFVFQRTGKKKSFSFISFFNFFSLYQAITKQSIMWILHSLKMFVKVIHYCP